MVGRNDPAETKTRFDMQPSADFQKRVAGYGLTTANIFYRLPDHRDILQVMVWQYEDIFPEFPRLHRFLVFWQKEIHGPLHSVEVAHQRLLKPAEVRLVGNHFQLH